ncbi:MAG: hypothetical protein H8E17_13200 [Deltaproteobacteria bacterium]|nr:hypothetical protein [Deltaproteobacteria bacterium]
MLRVAVEIEERRFIVIKVDKFGLLDLRDLRKTINYSIRSEMERFDGGFGGVTPLDT